MRTTRPNVVLAIVVGAIILTAVLAGFLAADSTAQEYDDATPEGVVQAYLAAVLDGDLENAAGLLAEGSPCDVDDLESSYLPDVDRVVLLGTRTDGNDARVEVGLVMTEGPFATFDFTEERNFVLTRAGADWRIAGSPWPMYECFKGF